MLCSMNQFFCLPLRIWIVQIRLLKILFELCTMLGRQPLDGLTVQSNMKIYRNNTQASLMVRAQLHRAHCSITCVQPIPSKRQTQAIVGQLTSNTTPFLLFQIWTRPCWAAVLISVGPLAFLLWPFIMSLTWSPFHQWMQILKIQMKKMDYEEVLEQSKCLWN